MTRIAIWLLEHLLPPDIGEPVIGDLVEQRDRHGRLWLSRETIVAIWRLRQPARLPATAIATFLGDLHIAGRLLRRSPTFAIASILTLGVAIGATTIIASVVEPVLVRSLPYPRASRLAMVWEREADGSPDNLGFATYRDLVSSSTTIAHAAAVGSWSVTLNRVGGEPISVDGERVSWTYFQTLGVHPEIGRDFSVDEDVPTRNQVVILSHGLWESAYGSDPAIVGKAISVSGSPATVVGVLPASFYNAIDPDAGIWRVLGYDNQPWTCRTCHHLTMVIRLRDGVTIAQAANELTNIHHRLELAYPKEYASVGVLAHTMQNEITEPYRPALLALAAATLLMLLIAGANVVNLHLARSIRREQELAVRTALGASNGRLIAQRLTEALLLAAVGGLVGIALAFAGLPLVVSHLPAQLPRLAAIHVDPGALAVTAAVVLTLTVVIGLAPGVGAPELAVTLRTGRRVAGSRRHLTRRLLVVGEVAATVVLGASAALLGKSLVRLLDVDPGFDPTHLLTVHINSAGPAYNDPARVFAYHASVEHAVRALPGVEDAALTEQVPLSGNVDMYGVLDPDNIPANPELVPSGDAYPVTSTYLRTMRIPLIEGRIFTDADAADTLNRVALVSTDLARALWPGERAVGKRIRLGGREGADRSVIGVVGNVRHHGLDLTVARQWYVPEAQWPANSEDVLVIRTAGDPEALIPTVRRTITAIDPTQPITSTVTMDRLIARSTAQRRLALVLFAAFAIGSLLLALAGIYGVLAGSVAERTREIGVRSALGATPAKIAALVLDQAGKMATLGLILGLAGAFALTRFLRALLFGIAPTDTTTVGEVVGLVSVAILAAAAIPAARAIRVDIAKVLRGE